MQPIFEIIVATTGAIFEDQQRKLAHTAKLKAKTEEDHYVAKNARLRELIDAVGKRLFTTEFSREHLQFGENPQPNRIRYIEMSIEGFTQLYFDDLRALLTGDFTEWRIRLAIYGNLSERGTLIGSVLIDVHQLLIDRALYELLNSRKFDFHCDRPPSLSREFRTAEISN